MRRLFILAALGMGLSACQDSKPPAPPQAPPPRVGIITIAPRDVTITQDLNGRVLASKVAEVRPQVSGIIEQRLFTEGAEVKEGDILYTLDAAPYTATVENAKATLDRAQSAVKAAVNKANRYLTLSNREIASQQDMEAAVAAADQAKADVAAAQAGLRAAQINLDRTKIRAPISGRISTSALTPGALVTASQATALTTIQTLDPVFVDVPASANAVMFVRNEIESGALKAFKEGILMTLQMQQGPYPHKGELRFANSAVSESTGTVTLRATFANPDRLLLPGMFVRGTAALGIQPNAIVVPQRVVSRNPRGEAVIMLVDAEGKAQERVVELGRTVGAEWIIDKGLVAGEKVIVDGLQRVRHGAPVTPVPFEQTAGAPAAPAAAKP